MDILTEKPVPKKNNKNYLRWFKHVVKHSRLLLIACVALFGVMLIEVFLPKVLSFVVDHMLIKKVMDAGVADLPFIGGCKLIHAFLIMLLFLIVLMATRAALIFTRNISLACVGERVHIDIRSSLFDHLQRLPISYFDKSYTGRIMARLTTDTDALWALLYNGTLQVVAPVFTIITVLIILSRIHLVLTLMVALVIPFVVVLMMRARVKAIETVKLQRETLADIYSHLQEQITGIRLVRIFGRSDDERRTYLGFLMDLYKRNMVMLRTMGILTVSSEFTTGIATAAVLCLGGIAVWYGQITVGELIQFYLYAGMLFAPLQMITGTSAQVFSTAEVALERIFDLLDQQTAEEVRVAGSPCPPLKGAISVRDLSFSYESAREIIKGVSLDIEPGKTVAFVGPSGVGKTTLVNLLCRFYNYEKGTITVDGIDIKTLDATSLRRQISYVAQDNFLFSGSIAENIRYANPSATQELIEETAKLANAHEFIMSMPKGYEMELGERGVKLSGGQKQRINIARALIRNPKILIMDEPTSALDAESESILLEAMKTVFSKLTCIIIAHRLSTVMTADMIFVFSEGTLVQQGKHQELIKEPGVYQDLCRKQLFGFGGSGPDGHERGPQES